MNYENWSPLRLYLHFEALDGCVDNAWVDAIKIALDPDAIHALADAQTYLLARNVLSEHDPLPRWTDNHHHFSAEERELLGRFFAEAVTEGFLQSMLGTAARTGKITIENPLGGKRISSDLSVCCGSILLLRFSSGREPFYMLQHNFAVEAMFFPLRRCVIGLRDCLSANVKIRRFFLRLRSGPGAWVDYYRLPKRVWGGIYFGNESPFHFFYFNLPGFYSAFAKHGSTAPAFHTLASELYLNLPEVFAADGEVKVHSTAQGLGDRLFAEGSFIFSLGLRPQIWLRHNQLLGMDQAVTSYCRERNLEELDRIRSSADLVVWGGVSSSKRAWIEESESLVMIVNELASEFDDILLILDGWTSTLVQAAPAELCGAEESVIEDISQRVSSNVKCLSLVGSNPVRKIALAESADFFAVGHATASMYVARFAGCGGVSHISNAARATVVINHLHPDTSLIPASFVTDIDTERGDVGRVSYHIDPRDFLRFAMSEFRRRRSH